MLLGCGNHQIEKDFFDKPPNTRIQRLRQYSIEDQYKIFRYGNDMIEPPLLELAAPIAERGAAAVPLLSRELNLRTSDITVRDILLICETMSTSGTYDVISDITMMTTLNSRDSEMN